HIDDHKTSLEGLIDYFDQFIECFQDHTISANYLSTGAVLIEYNKNLCHNKSKEGTEYIIPLNTNYHE
ncbi:9743_t:CDS:1, partial [Racocetra persica]